MITDAASLSETKSCCAECGLRLQCEQAEEETALKDTYATGGADTHDVGGKDEFGEFRCKDAHATGDADTYDVSGKDDVGEFW